MKNTASYRSRCASVLMALMFLVACDKKLQNMEPVIDLDSGLVYDFPFSENSIDQVSMVNFDTHGAKFQVDRFDKPASALCMTNNYMDLNAGFGEDKTGTLSFWINLRDVASFHPLFYKDYKSFVPGEYMFTVYAGGLSIYCAEKWESEEYEPVNVSTTIEANKWYHVLVRWSDTAGSMELFLNNRKLLSHDYVAGTYISNGVEYVTMGLAYRDPGSHQDPIPSYFRGTMDDIKRYNRWLNNEEVAALYE